MRIGITGGSGFLGREVVSQFKENLVPVIIGRSKNHETEHEYISTDYSTKSLDSAFRSLDAVIHLAAIRRSQNNISEFHENEIMMQNVCCSCINRGINNLVFASSISVYSDQTKIPWREDQLPAPKTYYGISKTSCEYIGQIFHKKFDLNVKSLRIAHVLGEDKKRKYMMNIFIDNAFLKKTLCVIGKSVAKREFVYVKDAARACLLAVNKPDNNAIFNIGGNGVFTNHEIAVLVNQCFDNNGNIDYNSMISEGIESSFMDSKKAEKALGYKPCFTIKQALLDIRKIKEGMI